MLKTIAMNIDHKAPEPERFAVAMDFYAPSKEAVDSVVELINSLTITSNSTIIKNKAKEAELHNLLLLIDKYANMGFSKVYVKEIVWQKTIDSLRDLGFTLTNSGGGYYINWAN